MIPEEMKINKFKEVKIPRKRDYMKSFGLSPALGENYTGDEPFQESGNKLETMQELRSWDEKNIPPTNE